MTQDAVAADASLGEPVLHCRGLDKRFGAVHALNTVDFTLRRGEVRALLGKNGAGKSTLVNLISGAFKPDQGSIALAGKPVQWDSPGAARAGGISVVHQEFSLVPGLTVAENITMGRWPRGRFGFIDADAMAGQAKAALDQLGVDLPLWQEVGKLSLAQQQMVEIAKALVDNPHILILDEPTSALNANEVDLLLALVRGLATTGVAIIYVSHRMKEIPQVAHTVTVFRDGREVATERIEDAPLDKLALLVAGEAADVRAVEPRDRSAAPVVLATRHLALGDLLVDVNFELHEGEVLGLAGHLGSGRTETLECIFGLRTPTTGEVLVDGQPVAKRQPRTMLDRRVAMTSEDRKGQGIVPALGVGENMVLTARGRVLPHVWLAEQREATLEAETMATLAIRAHGPDQEIVTLSGGNQQKGVIGRALASDMRVIMFDEPTRGIDVHAKTQIYALIRSLAEQGVASIFVSSELEEMPLVCDRVVVLRGGRDREQLTGDGITAEKILTLVLKED